MFALSIEALIEAINAKKKEDLTIRGLLYFVVPDAQFGYPENSTGEFEIEADYNALVWLDERAKPTWSQLQDARQDLFDFERAIDFDQLRQMRYAESTIQHSGKSFSVNPTASMLLMSQISLADSTAEISVSYLDSNKRLVSLSIENARTLQRLIQMKINQWIIDPRVG